MDIIKFDSGDFGLVSVPPWVKWYTLLTHYEMQMDKDLDLESELSVTDEVNRFISILKQDLKVELSIDNHTVYTPSSQDFFVKIGEVLTEKQKKWVHMSVKLGLSFYVPEISGVFISKTSLNHTAEGALALLHGQISKYNKTPILARSEFYQYVWLQVLYYFGSKLINPKRKADTLSDLSRQITESKRKKFSNDAQSLDNQIKASQFVISQKINEALFLSGIENKMHTGLADNPEIYLLSSALLGAMVGDKLYFVYRKGKIKLDKIFEYMVSPSSDWGKSYLEVIKLIEPYRDPFLSKKLKI